MKTQETSPQKMKEGEAGYTPPPSTYLFAHC